MKKLGRPTDNPKNLNTRIRLSNEEVKMLEELSSKLKITKSEVIRLGIKKMYELNK